MDSSAEQALVSEFSEDQAQVYATYAAFALLLYDYVLTMPLEISEIWNGRFTLAKFFYILNRYGIIAYFCIICVVDNIQTQSTLTCKVIYCAQYIVGEIADIGVIGIFCLRTFAIYNNNWIVLSALTTLGIARITLALTASFYEATYQILPSPISKFGSCGISYPDVVPYLRSYTAEFILVLAFDTIVVILTIAKTWRLYRQWKAVSSDWQTSLTAVLLHDGIMYYCCVEVLIIVSVCLNLIPNISFILVGVVSIFQNAFILTSRLVLNLKQVGKSNEQHEAPSFPSLAFATNSFVGNLGESFRVSNDDGEDEKVQEPTNDEFELQEKNGEGQAAPMVEDA